MGTFSGSWSLAELVVDRFLDFSWKGKYLRGGNVLANASSASALPLTLGYELELESLVPSRFESRLSGSWDIDEAPELRAVCCVRWVCE